MYKQILKERQMMRKCVGCKTDIVWDHPNRRLCSECRKNSARRKKEYNKNYLRERYVPKRILISCVVCKKICEKRYKNAKYCGDSCKSKHFKKKWQIQRWEKRILVLQGKIDEMKKHG